VLHTARGPAHGRPHARRGWPPELASLKQHITRSLGAALPPEQSGSRWPKTSLAALHGNRRLLPHELATLQRICVQCTALLRDECQVVFDTLSVIQYRNRRALLAVNRCS